MRDGFKLGVIASSISLVDCVREISEETATSVEVALQGLEEAIPAGKEMERAGIEVIVGRGGTAHLLRENLHIPVLSIPLTYLDILSSVREAASVGRRILLTTFRSKLSSLGILREIFPIELKQGIFNNRDSLEKVIISAQKEGYEVVIGGGLSMRYAREYGLRGIELKTAKETVLSVLEDARSVARSKREEQEKAERYRCIVDSVSEGVIAVDRDGCIMTMNRSAREALQINDDPVAGQHISTYVACAPVLKVIETGKPLFNKLETINKNLYVSNHVPVMVGAALIGGVSTFKDVSNVMKAEGEVRRSFAKGLVAKYSLEDFIHKSSVIQDVITRAQKYAASDSTLLITGETGTGKEILAQGIHKLGPRRRGPFVSINCAALPEQLLESELFGYDEGAFTGSRRGGKAGLFEIAHQGVIFLDEIGSTPLSVQTRLLRVLQEKEVMRIGGDRLIPVDVRVLAATNVDLITQVQDGMMRDDLFFRLNMLAIHIPPLRRRIEDIPLLVEKLLERAAGKYSRNPLHVPDSGVRKLMQYAWPGNVRQLENFLERLTLLSGPRFQREIFEELYSELTSFPLSRRAEAGQSSASLKDYSRQETTKVESELIRRTLEDARFSRTRAAEKLGISRTTLWRKLKELDSLS